MAAIMYILAKKDFDSYKKLIENLHRTGYTKINDYEVDINKSKHLLEMNPNTNKLYPKNSEGGMPFVIGFHFLA